MRGLGNWEITRWGDWGMDIEDGGVREQRAERKLAVNSDQ
jgi:hypothetical protein